MEKEKEVRLDKWLWAVRVFKTRTIATDACKKNRVSVNGSDAKPSKTIKVGDEIKVRKPPITYTFEVLDVTEKRMGAKLVPDFMKNLTPPEEFEFFKLQRLQGFQDRAKGLGRPTKKDRRELDDFTDFYDLDFDGLDWEEEEEENSEK